MSLKVSEIKAAVALIQKNNKEALAEIGNKISDLNQQIKDLLEGVSDPSVTDEAFEADLKAAAEDTQALADIVSGTPPTP